MFFTVASRVTYVSQVRISLSIASKKRKNISALRGMAKVAKHNF